MQLGLDGVPAVTVNRFCASSLQTARMAYHAIKAGEGDAFVSAGVECISRYRGFAHAGVDVPEVHNPAFAAAEAAHPGVRGEQRGLARSARRRPAAGHLHLDGPDGGASSPPCAASPGREQDEFGVRSQNRCEKAIANGVFEAEIAPVTLPDGSMVSTDDGPRPGATFEAVAGAQAGIPGRRHRHRRPTAAR